MSQLGRYEILDELGSGSMGTVFRGRDPVIDREVAVKTIRMQGFSPGETAGFRERFFREAQAAGKLSHPGIVTIHDVGEDESTRTPYIVMEFIAGQTLDALIREASAPLPAEKALGIIKQVAEALDYAHAEGIVHRDIKPANIILTPAGRAIIMDFGVARLRKSQVTVQGEMIGTPAFMSPEQVQGERVDGRADLFSLGVILYYMLTLERPFSGELADIMFKIVYRDPALPSSLNPALRPDFDSVIARALAKPRDARYQSGKEFVADLDCLLSGQSPRAPAPAPTATVPTAEQTVRLPSAEPLATLPLAPGPRERASDVASKLFGRWQGLNMRVRPIPYVTAHLRGLQRPAQIAELIAVLAVIAFIGWLFSPSPQSTMAVLLQHNFRVAAVSIWVDDDLVLKENLVHDEVHRSLLGATRYVGRYSGSVHLRAGDRAIRVQVTSTDPAFDETRDLRGTFAKDAERTLSISCDARRNSLTLSLR
ncbi:MAG: serine/threonine protein kinase [Acidobacteria bacterium]|nr:serine/threonine protein kinase [Acidobacteriota bacterium]